MLHGHRGQGKKQMKTGLSLLWGGNFVFKKGEELRGFLTQILLIHSFGVCDQEERTKAYFSHCGKQNNYTTF